MNLSVSNPPLATTREANTLPGRSRIWPVLAGVVLFPMLQYGLAMRLPNDLLALAASASAYVLCIWLYRTVTILVRSGHRARLLAAGFMAAVVAAMVAPIGQLHAALANTVMIPVAGVVVGQALSGKGSKLRAYLLGTAVVAIGGLIIYVPQWELLMNGFQALGEENASFMSQSMTAMGYHAEASREYAEQFQRLWSGIVRVIPAMTIMSLVSQFSIGFLWFLIRPGSVSTDSIKTEPFSRWKVPFGLAPVLLVAVVGRLWGGATAALFADNILLALSLYYCVGGLALVAYGLQRIRVGMFVKVLFYFMLTLMGVPGYVVCVLLGFIDSFADWRKVHEDSIELRTE